MSGKEYLKREHEVPSTQEVKLNTLLMRKEKRSKRSLEEDDPKHHLKVKIDESIETGSIRWNYK